MLRRRPLLWRSRTCSLFDTGCVSCDRDFVKTISLTESAYQRLSSWKEGGTFSEVVERMVPAKGTIASALAAAESLPDLPDKAFDALEKSVGATRAQLPPGWT